MTLFDDLNIAIVANAIVKTPALKRYFLNIYEENTLECSSLLKEYEMIDDFYVTGRKLIDEIEFRKCISVLIFVLKKEQHLQVMKFLKSNFSKHYLMLKNDDIATFNKMISKLNSIDEPIFLGLCYFIYSFSCLSGVVLEGKIINATLNMYSTFRVQVTNEKERVKQLTVKSEGMYDYFKNSNNFHKSIMSEDDLAEFYFQFLDKSLFTNKLFVNYIGTEVDGLLCSLCSYAVINEIFSIQGLPISQIINTTLTPKEQKTITTLINNKMHMFYPPSMFVEGAPFKRENYYPTVDILYVVGLLTYKLVEEYKKSKITHFSNDNNEILLQNKLYQKEISELKEQIRNQKAVIKENENNILNLQAENKKNTKEILAPVESENRELKDRIIQLEKELNEEKTKNSELNSLREFIFSLEHKDVPKTNDTSLAQLLENKKVVIIGGHENWQSKMKKEYPTIIMINGHQNFDTNVLKNADKVIFYTANLSHSIYYLAINYLRVNNIPFNYIGKHNVDLVEEEIKDILSQ